MNALRTVIHEFLGLVVDDVVFAVAVVGWIALAWLLSAHVLPPGPWAAALLFGGLGAILLENVARRSGEA